MGGIHLLARRGKIFILTRIHVLLFSRFNVKKAVLLLGAFDPSQRQQINLGFLLTIRKKEEQTPDGESERSLCMMAKGKIMVNAPGCENPHIFFFM